MTIPSHSDVGSAQAVPASNVPPWSGRRLSALTLAGWLFVACIGLWEGPDLGEHEVIVAQTARQMIQTGEWLVPHYLDTPFLVKPPLMPWLVAAAGLVLPADPVTGLPVTDLAARVPSVLAALVLIWLVARLGRELFGPRIAGLAAFVCASSLGLLLYAFNATVEMVLTTLCAWAFAEFWWAMTARSMRRRLLHLLLFYGALGLAMLAKGPMPMVLVVMPLAAWWWLERPVRLLTACGRRRAGAAFRLAVWQAWPRLRQAVTRLGLWWGIPLFLLFFVPWMVYVAGREKYAWQLWEYEYLQRMEGDYPGSGQGNIFYYLPIVLGLALPWALSVPEALAGPFLRAFRRHRRPMVYLWFWVVVGGVFMSAMTFKKPYYLLPALPALSLLLAVVLERFFFGGGVERPRLARVAVAVILAAVVGLGVGLWWFGSVKYPEFWDDRQIRWGVPLAFAGMLVGVAAACFLYLARQRGGSFLAVGLTSVVVFITCWGVAGSRIANSEPPRAIVDGLRAAGVPDDEVLYWAGLRPDGRALFYGGRPVGQLVDPYRLIAEHGEKVDRDRLKMMVATEICGRLESPEAVYIVLKRDAFESLMTFFKPPAAVLFAVDRGDPGDDQGDWLVISNAPATSRPVGRIP